MDAFVLPGLLILIVGFYIGVWRAWLGDERGRALRVDDDDTQEPFA